MIKQLKELGLKPIIEVIDVVPIDDTKKADIVNIMSAKLDTKQKKKRQTNPNSLANLNPHNGLGGRPKLPAEFKEVVKCNTVPALMTVINIMQDSNAKAADRLKAAEIIIERAYGKAVQPIIGDINTNSLVVKLEGQLADWAK